MKKLKNRFIRICTPVLCLLLLLPSFCLWAVAETQSTENGMSSQALESAEALDLQRAELVSDLDEESLIFNYVDRASFIEAGHVERVCEDEEPNTYVFKNADGSKTVYFLDEDVKYVNAGGEATEKKLDLVALDGGYATRASNVSLALPNAIASGVTLAYNGNSVTLTPKPQSLTGGTVTMSAGSALTANGTASAGMGTGVGMTADLEAALMEQALQIAPVGIASGKADYQGAFGTGTTLRYTPTLSGVKEDVILDAYRGQNTFAFTLNTGSLSVFEENGQYYIAPTADTEEKILISDTWVYDAAGNFEKGTLSVVQVKNGLYLLTVGASVDFLTDENTVYPVYIDPTLTVNSGTDYIEDTTIYAGKPTQSFGTAAYLDVGKLNDSYGVGRAVMRLTGLTSSSTYNDLHGALIDEVKLHMRKRSGDSDAVTLSIYPLVNTIWSAGSVTWNNVGAHLTEAMASAAPVTGSMTEIDITDLVYDWKTENAWYPARPEAGFIIISSDETVQNRYASSEVSSSSYKPYVTLNYSEGVKILHPEQPYRAVGEDETVYVGQGMSVQFKIAGYPASDSFSWTVDDTTVATVNSSTGLLNAVSAGCVTVTVAATELGSYTDSIEVWVVPIVPGEYYIESPLITNCFIEPLTDGAVGDYFTIGVLSDNEDNSFIVEFIHSGDFGYYTFKKEYTDSEGTVSERYLGFSSASVGAKLKFYNNCSTNTKWFDIEKCPSGYYKITPQASAQLGRVLSSDADPVTGEYLTIQSYTLDSGFKDEWIFRRVLPRSGSEREIVRKYFNSSAANADRIDCYSYALNSTLNRYLGMAPVKLGESAGYAGLINSPALAYDLFRFDGAQHGFYVYPISKYEPCPEGYYKVAVFCESLTDSTKTGFHMIRQNINGSWSHKLGEYTDQEGAGVISLVDANGRIIIDPETSNLEYSTKMGLNNMRDYQCFLGYYAVNPEHMFLHNGIPA